jgi:hypothetical protein
MRCGSFRGSLVWAVRLKMHEMLRVKSDAAPQPAAAEQYGRGSRRGGGPEARIGPSPKTPNLAPEPPNGCSERVPAARIARQPRTRKTGGPGHAPLPASSAGGYFKNGRGSATNNFGCMLLPQLVLDSAPLKLGESPCEVRDRGTCTALLSRISSSSSFPPIKRLYSFD